MSVKHLSQHSWRDNSELLLKRRISGMRVGDMLEHPQGWKVICIFTNSKLPQFQVLKDNVKVFPNKNSTPECDAVLKYFIEVVKLESVCDLTLVEEGALPYMRYSHNKTSKTVKQTQKLLIQTKKANYKNGDAQR